MSDEQTGSAGEDTTPAVTAITLDADAPSSFDSAESAVASLVGAREKAGIPAESADDATAEEELSDEDNPESPKETTGEDKEAEPAKPAIEPPKSWTKDLHDHWNTLDPVLQERIVARDREDQTAIKRAFNEAADARKAVEVELAQAREAKQQYLNKVPSLDEIRQFVQNGPFADIKTQDDADALAQNDPFRYLQWDAYQKRMAGVAEQSRQAEALKTQEKLSKRASYEAEQNKLLADLVPEMADPKKSVELRERAVSMLTDDLGMKRDQLERWMNDDIGHEILSNAGFQKLVADGLKYRDILSAPKAVVKADLPPVQRPGVARAPGADKAALVQSLTDKLSNSGSENDAFELLMAKRANRRAS